MRLNLIVFKHLVFLQSCDVIKEKFWILEYIFLLGPEEKMTCIPLTLLSYVNMTG